MAAPEGPRLPIVVGANHRSSSMAVRDRLFIDAAAMPEFLAALKNAGIGQAMILSTSERVEIEAVVEDSAAATAGVIGALAAHSRLTAAEIEGAVYTLTGPAAVRHLFAVTASLDALVVGEPGAADRVLGAQEAARTAAMNGPGLDSLVAAAIATAARVGRETTIGTRPVSIASAAVQTARDLHGELARCTCLLLGAGAMGELVAEALIDAGLGHLMITHPSARRAEALGRGLDCHIGAFEDLADLLAKSDIVLTSMNARHYSIDAKQVKSAIDARRRKPIFLIDTGVPGDIDIEVEKLEDAFHYDLDDLERVANEGRLSEQAEAQQAWHIVDEEADRYPVAEAGPDVDKENNQETPP